MYTHKDTLHNTLTDTLLLHAHMHANTHTHNQVHTHTDIYAYIPGDTTAFGSPISKAAMLPMANP